MLMGLLNWSASIFNKMVDVSFCFATGKSDCRWAHTVYWKKAPNDYYCTMVLWYKSDEQNLRVSANHEEMFLLRIYVGMQSENNVLISYGRELMDTPQTSVVCSWTPHVPGVVCSWTPTYQCRVLVDTPRTSVVCSWTPHVYQCRVLMDTPRSSVVCLWTPQVLASCAHGHYIYQCRVLMDTPRIPVSCAHGHHTYTSVVCSSTPHAPASCAHGHHT